MVVERAGSAVEGLGQVSIAPLREPRGIRAIMERELAGLKLEYPYPYTPEVFTPEEEAQLSKNFSNTNLPVYFLMNLDQEVAGALLSRFSRSDKSARRLFLDEFLGDPKEGVAMVEDYLRERFGHSKGAARAEAARLYARAVEAQDLAEEKGKKRKRRFYKKVHAQYGDDSTIQMGSVHFIIERASAITEKEAVDRRLGAAYIGQSSRYLRFDRQENGRYMFTDVPELRDTEFKERMDVWNRECFDAYAENLEPARAMLKRKYPIETVDFVDDKGNPLKYENATDDKLRRTLRQAYNRAVEAKSFDVVRVFLPVTAVSNTGLHFSGQAAELAINSMLSSPYKEAQIIGLMVLQEGLKVAPSFLESVAHRYGSVKREYLKEDRLAREAIAKEYLPKELTNIENKGRSRLVDMDEDADTQIAAQILFAGQEDVIFSYDEILQYVNDMKKRDLEKGEQFSSRVARIINEGKADRRKPGRNRRHKLGRPFEHGFATVEFYGSFAMFRDLQRNRLASLQRLRLHPHHLHVPPEFLEPEMAGALARYQALHEQTQKLHKDVEDSGIDGAGRAGEYINLFGHKVRFTVKANIRQWVFFSELRTIPGGDTEYRQGMQEAVQKITKRAPIFADLFTHVDWTENYGLGRVAAEVRTQRLLEAVEEAEEEELEAPIF